jgi:hypothetical protein
MTKSIQHTFHISAPKKDIIRALIHEKQIQQWWTTSASIISRQGLFQWEGYGWAVGLNIKSPNDHTVVWTCTASNMQNTNAWEGSTMTFDLVSNEAGTTMNFTQSDYKDSPCFDTCNEGWKFFWEPASRVFLKLEKAFPTLKLKIQTQNNHSI